MVLEVLKGGRVLLAVEHQVDAPLPEQLDLFRPVPADQVEAELPQQRPDRAGPLTQREREVLERSRAGSTSSRLARDLGISHRTVDKHLENAYRKLGVTNRVAAFVADETHPRRC